MGVLVILAWILGRSQKFKALRYEVSLRLLQDLLDPIIKHKNKRTSRPRKIDGHFCLLNREVF